MLPVEPGRVSESSPPTDRSRGVWGTDARSDIAAAARRRTQGFCSLCSIVFRVNVDGGIFRAEKHCADPPKLLGVCLS